VTPDNNLAQSNYTWMATSTSSPSTREATVVMASNPYDVPALIRFEINQPSPLFRTYLGHRWMRLSPVFCVGFISGHAAMRTRWRSRRKPARFISFTASEKGGQEVVVDAAYVRERMAPLTQKGDLSRFIL